MSYGQVKDAIRQGAVVAPAPHKQVSADARFDALTTPQVLALDDPKLLLATLRRIWSAQEQKQAISKDASVVSSAADAVILTEAFRPFDPKSILSCTEGFRALLGSPDESITATEDALKQVGDQRLVEVFHSLDGRKRPPRNLGDYSVPQWRKLIATLPSSELEAQLAAFVRAHPDSTILPPLENASSIAWVGDSDWKQAAIEHVSVLRGERERQEEARLDALPMRELMKESDHVVLWSVDRRVDRKLRDVEVEQLTPLERSVHLLTSLVAQVANGGFDQYFFNSTGDYAMEAKDALVFVHADTAASIYNRALAFFPEGKPSKNFVVRDEQIDQINKTHPDAWHALNEAFWASPTEEVTAKLIAAIRASPDQIQASPQAAAGKN